MNRGTKSDFHQGLKLSLSEAREMLSPEFKCLIKTDEETFRMISYLKHFLSTIEFFTMVAAFGSDGHLYQSQLKNIEFKAN